MKPAETEVMMGDEQPRDRKGRRRLTRERRAEVVKEYEASGLTQAEFARRAGLNATTFAHWVQRARRDLKAKTLAPAVAPVAVTPRFVEVQAAAVAPVMAAAATRLSVSLSDGVVVRGADPLALAALVRALRANAADVAAASGPANLRIYLAVEPVDMRKQYDGVWALAEQHLRLDPFGGALFVFTNKSRDRIKLLHWDGTGGWVLAKRLEKGRFSWPVSANGSTRRVDLEPAACSMLLAGIDLKDGAKKAWYERG